jgi:hypothetical protein
MKIWGSYLNFDKPIHFLPKDKLNTMWLMDWKCRHIHWLISPQWYSIFKNRPKKVAANQKFWPLSKLKTLKLWEMLEYIVQRHLRGFYLTEHIPNLQNESYSPHRRACILRKTWILVKPPNINSFLKYSSTIKTMIRQQYFMRSFCSMIECHWINGCFYFKILADVINMKTYPRNYHFFMQKFP